MAKPVPATGQITYTLKEDKNGDGEPNWGDTLAWDYSTTGESPWVQITCHQDDELVYAAYFGPRFGVNYAELSSPSWTGGAASCRADLSYKDGRKTRHTYLDFEVGA